SLPPESSTAPEAAAAAQQPSAPAGEPPSTPPATAAQPGAEGGAQQTPAVTSPPAPSGPATTATITAQPPVPATEGAASESEKAADEKPTLPWSAALIWRQGYVVAGFDRGTGQTFNPTYTWTFIALLGYELDKDTSLSL